MRQAHDVINSYWEIPEFVPPGTYNIHVYVHVSFYWSRKGRNVVIVYMHVDNTIHVHVLYTSQQTTCTYASTGLMVCPYTNLTLRSPLWDFCLTGNPV